ncbi:hypothetical protein BJ508DRAFT_152665 [Ascobolus immersus RN42]|uniref:SUZ domain-containing protein n=1 Tax=Ascobolus immersus RN42 TaxID=1160509 RepID=A0A3N4I287_ASCIM|nr:hypothetical protein BJ508DRAFT_152665 [Ascobolus immersus RN42]
MSQTPASQPRFTVLARPAISSSASPPAEETTSPPADSSSTDQSTSVVEPQSIADDQAKQDSKSSESAASDAKATAKPAIIAKKVLDPWTVEDWETAADRDPPATADIRPEEVNKKLWETANQFESVEILPSNTPQPRTLYKPEVKILKRTASATPPPSSRKESSQTAAESLKERERRYKEAREKLFGPESEAQDSSNSRSGSPGPNEGSGNNSGSNNNQKNGGKKKNKRREKDADAEANSQLPPISVPIRAPKGPDSLGFGFGRGGGSGGRGGRGAGVGRGAAPTRGLNDGTVAAIAQPVPQDPIDYITRADPTGGRGGYMLGQHGQMMQGNMMGMGYGFPQQQQQTMGGGSSNYSNHLMQGQGPQMGHGQNRMMSSGIGMPVNQGIQSPAVQQLWNSAAGQGYPPQQQINTTMFPMHGLPSSRSPHGATGVSNVPNQWNPATAGNRGLGAQGVNPSLASQGGPLNPQAVPHNQTMSSNPWGQPPQQQQQSQLQQPQHYIPTSQQQQPTYAQQATQNSYPQYSSLYSSQLQQQSQPQSQSSQQQTSAWGPIGRNIPPQAIPTAALGRGLPSSNNSRSASGVTSPAQGQSGLVGNMEKLRLWEPGR